jgi:hypothetical protein
MTIYAHNLSSVLWLLQAKAKARVEVVGSGKGCAAAKSTATAGGHVLAASLHCRQQVLQQTLVETDHVQRHSKLGAMSTLSKSACMQHACMHPCTQ